MFNFKKLNPQASKAEVINAAMNLGWQVKEVNSGLRTGFTLIKDSVKVILWDTPTSFQVEATTMRKNYQFESYGPAEVPDEITELLI